MGIQADCWCRALRCVGRKSCVVVHINVGQHVSCANNPSCRGVAEAERLSYPFPIIRQRSTVLCTAYGTLFAAPQPRYVRTAIRHAMQAMESITAKINAIFDNENDAWQEMTLEVRAGAALFYLPYARCREKGDRKRRCRHLPPTPSTLPVPGWAACTAPI